MKKKLLCTAAVLLFLVQPYTYVSAKSNYYNGKVKVAIKKYKTGNYTGCIQDCNNIVKTEPSNALAYYYLAMSYTQAGKKDEAVKYYKKVLSFKTNPKLTEYATTGKRCLETPDQCTLKPAVVLSTKPKEELSDIDKFVASPSEDGLSPEVRKDFQQKHLNAIKNEINSNKDMDNYNFEHLNDASESDSQKKEQVNLAQKPTDAEIKAALKVLNDAGIDQNSLELNSYGNTSNETQQTLNYQNPELMELNAFMGSNSQTPNNNSMLNMMPYMLSQNKGGKSNYSPQLMQAMIMNSMMGNMNYNIDVDKDK